MCVAVPGKVVDIGAPMPGVLMGEVEFGDRTLEVNLIMIPDIEVGDHILVHSGYAVRVIPEEVASDATGMFRENSSAID